MRLIIFFLVVGVVVANNYETLRDNCKKGDHDDHDDLNSAQFECLFMQFDTDYNNKVNEHEFETAWKHYGLDYTYRAPVFFLETDLKNGDYMITTDDMNYLMKLWDSNGDGRVSDKELHDGWYAFYYDRFHH